MLYARMYVKTIDIRCGPSISQNIDMHVCTLYTVRYHGFAGFVCCWDFFSTMYCSRDYQVVKKVTKTYAIAYIERASMEAGRTHISTVYDLRNVHRQTSIIYILCLKYIHRTRQQTNKITMGIYHFVKLYLQ